jgi:CubicO group peptidase (beta-lactamase class C family)
MERILWPRGIAGGAQARSLARSSAPFPLRYEYNGNTYTIEDIFSRQRITGLLVFKDDTIIYERYQYDRTAADKFASFSMAKTVVALLVGIALEEGALPRFKTGEPSTRLLSKTQPMPTLLSQA